MSGRREGGEEVESAGSPDCDCVGRGTPEEALRGDREGGLGLSITVFMSCERTWHFHPVGSSLAGTAGQVR